jgi:2-hydroxychromene-2-carboxylate isomerase
MEIWFDFGSNYSYLSLMRIEALARDAGVGLAWRPFLLGPIFRELGWETSPFVLQAEKGRYTWIDMRRRAAKYGLAFNLPSSFPRSAVLATRVALVGAEQPWIGDFCRRVMLQNFVEDLDIGDASHTRRALDGLVPDPDAVMEAAQTAANKARLRQQTTAARAKGIFGAPTFFVGDEMFWGDDRLEDALEHALIYKGAVTGGAPGSKAT